MNTIKFGNLTIKITQSPAQVVYEFRGDVDEHFRHRDVPRVKSPNIIFELQGINNFNSVGIREWIYLVRDLSALGSLVFRHCSVTMIDQINMVPDSLANGNVESFYAPYYCAEHGEVNKLIQVADARDDLAMQIAPEMRCDKCQERLTFDALEASYFLFATNVISRAS